MHPIRCLFVASAFLLLPPAPAAAQQWDQPWSDPRDRPPRVDVSVSVGVLAPTDWSDLVLLGSISPVAGVLEQVLVRDVRIEPDRVVGAAVTYWRDRYGFRVQGALSRSSLVTGAAAAGDATAALDEVASVAVDSWFYDVRGAIGLVEYAPTRVVWAYVFLGFGGITYDLERRIVPPLLTFVERGTRLAAGAPILVVEEAGRQFVLAIDELDRETVFALNFGLGTDLRIPLGSSGLGVRLELSDHVSPSPLTVRISELGRGGPDVVSFGYVHHLRAAAGLVVQIGR
ncbi:MAG TPA: hypothetical protein VNK92_03670 [Vicinamibacterales bacterium]|nr:hypothetical protein [Vicinamibacterales bacterium]